MAFCNACGATVEPGAKFCPKCGAAVPAAAVASTPATPAQSNAVKVILIVVAIVVGLSILGIGTATFIGWRIARHTRVAQDGDRVRVETPFGTVESNNNPDETARNLGIDIYPGAFQCTGEQCEQTRAVVGPDLDDQSARWAFEPHDPRWCGRVMDRNSGRCFPDRLGFDVG